jgi:hypothetical protein
VRAWALLPFLVACGSAGAPGEESIAVGRSAPEPAPSRSERLVAAPAPSPGPDLSAATPNLPTSLACENDVGHPTELYCTGLYARWPSLHLAMDVKEYDPGLHLWSDGAEKRRFIWLPPGKMIDTSDMDDWVFPVGTKVWKEFSLSGKKVETRFLQKLDDGTWFRTTYAWSDDETRATEIVYGAENVRGTDYAIPPQAQCATCHKGRKDGVLGFEAIALSSPGATGVTIDKLVNAHLVTDPPAAPLDIPGDGREQAALGWLHMNCGVACHNRNETSEAGYTGLEMRLTSDALDSVQTTDTWRTAVGVTAYFQPVAGFTFMRIAPRDVARSLIPYRDGNRDDPKIQMPPIATHVVDAQGLAAVKAWIDGM